MHVGEPLLRTSKKDIYVPFVFQQEFSVFQCKNVFRHTPDPSYREVHANRWVRRHKLKDRLQIRLSIISIGLR